MALKTQLYDRGGEGILGSLGGTGRRSGGVDQEFENDLGDIVEKLVRNARVSDI